MKRYKCGIAGSLSHLLIFDNTLARPDNISLVSFAPPLLTRWWGKGIITNCSMKMKAVPIFFNGVRLKDVYPHATRWQVMKYKTIRFIRWLIIRAGIAAAAVALLFTGYLYNAVTAPNLNVVNQVITVAAKDVAPILHKICMAESSCQQFDKNGIPTMHANTNGSVDIGKYQINNRVWGATARKLGYDLMTEEGQDKMATYLLENKGSGPWFSSSKNWE